MPEDVAMDMTGAGAAAYAQSWQSAQFGPGAPTNPVRPLDEQPRVFDFPPGINLYMTPRGGYGLLPFAQLRSFASLCEEVRIVVESIKREIRALEWDFVPRKKGDKTNYDKDKDALCEFWEKPDGQRDFDSWLNSVLDDMLVIDAPSLWLHMEGDALTSVDQIDGALIRPLLDVRGKTPTAPLPAYVQMIKGQVWQWFTNERLVYKPFNANITSPYGTSPIEFMIIRINQALRKKFSDAQYWDQTNVPEAILGLPADWTTEQISTFQEYFDALLVGDTAKLRRLKFLPSNGTNLPVYEFRRPAETTVFDEWMLKLACWCFGFTPAELGIVSGSGLGGKGFMEGAENTQYRLGFGPMVQYVESLITSIVRMQTKAPLAFKFMNIGPQEDQVKDAQLAEIELRNGIIDMNVWREKRGQPPIPNVKPFMLINGVPIFADELFAVKPVANADGADGAQNAQGAQAAPAAAEQPAPVAKADAPKTEAAAGAGDGNEPAKALAEEASTIQATALNGAQITSLSGLVTAVAAGELPYESARNLIEVAFPTIAPEKIEAILAPVKNAKPAEAVQAAPATAVALSDPAAGDEESTASNRDDEGDAEDPSEMIKGALINWHGKVRFRMKQKRSLDCEPPIAVKALISPDLEKRVRGQLAIAKTPLDVAIIFKTAREAYNPKAVGHLLGKADEAGHPTGGRNTLEARMQEWLTQVLAALAGELPAIKDDDDGEAIVKELLAADAPFWAVFIATLLPGLFKWLARMARLGVSEARNPDDGDGMFSVPPKIVAGVSWDLVNDDARAWARSHAGELIRGITDVTRDRIRKALADSIKKGETMPDLVKRITAVIDDRRRAEVIAATESTNAFSAGNEVAWTAAGIWGSQWFTAQDEFVCEVCGPLAGQIRPLGQPFIHPETKEEIKQPSAHPRCRCYRQPVVNKPDDWDADTGISPSVSQRG